MNVRFYTLAILTCLIAVYLPPKDITAHSQTLADHTSDASPESHHEIDRLMEQGFQQLYTGQLQKASASFQQAIERNRQVGERIGEAQGLLGISEAQSWLSQSQESLEVAQQALLIYQDVKDRTGEASALHRVGDAYLDLDKVDEGLSTLQQALVIRREVKDRQGEGWTLGLLGIGQLKKGQVQEGLDSMQQSIAILREPVAAPEQLRQQYRQAVILAWIGNAYRQQKQYEQTKEPLQKAFNLTRSLGNQPVERLTLIIQGRVQAEQEQLPEALATYQQALKVAQSLDDKSAQAEIQALIGDVYSKQSKYDDAIAAYQQAMRLYKAIGDQAGVAWRLYDIAYTYLNQQQYEQARSAFQQQLEAARKIGDRTNEVQAITGIGLSYSNYAIQLLRDGSYPEAITVAQQAIEPFQQALDLAKAANLDSGILENAIIYLASAYYWQASAHANQQQYPEAIIALQQKLAVLEDNRDRLPKQEYLRQRILVIQPLGIAYSNNGQYAEALATHQKAAQIAEQLNRTEQQFQNLYFVAFAHRQLGNFREALTVSQEILTLVREKLPDNQEEEMQALTILALVYGDLGQYPSQLEANQQALKIAKAIGNISFEASLLNNIGGIYHKQGEYLQALEYYQQSLSMNQTAIQQLKENPAVAVQRFCSNFLDQQDISTQQKCLELFEATSVSQLSNVGLVYAELGRYVESLSIHQQALAIAQRYKAIDRQITVLNNIGTLSTTKGEYNDALKAFQQVLQIALDTGDRPSQATALNNIGQVYNAQGQYNAALESYQKSLALAREIGDSSNDARTLNNIGTVYSAQGNLDAALTAHQQAMAISQKLGESISIDLNNIASVYESQGRYVEALSLLQQALEITRNTGNRPNEAIILENLSRLYAQQADYTKALDLQQQSAKLRQSFGSRSSEISNLLASSRLNYYLGQYNQVLTDCQQAVTLSQALGTRPSEVNGLSCLGATYRKQHQDAQALESYRQALATAQQMGDVIGDARTQRAIASIYQRQGKSAEAVTLLEDALKTQRDVGARSDQADTLNKLGLAYSSLGRTTEALSALQQALAIFREVKEPAAQAEVLVSLGQVLESNKQPELAIAFLKQSVNIHQTIRNGIRGLSSAQQQSYTESVSATYRRLAGLLLDQGRLLEAEQVLELLKQEESQEYTRASVDRTGKVEQTETEKTIIEKYGSLTELGQQIKTCEKDSKPCDELYAQRQQVTTEYNQAVQAIEAVRVNTPDNSAVITSSVLGIGSKLIAAHPDTILIHTVVLPDDLYIFWIGKGGIASSIKVNVFERELNTAISQFRQHMKDCEQGGCDSTSAIQEIQAISQKLHGWLLPQPLLDELKKNNIKNLVFSLDRNIRYIPMATLFDGNQYLIERYTVSAITSVGATHTTSAPFTPNNTSVIALGLSEPVPANPAQNIPEFGRLDQVPTELDEIVNNQQAPDPNGGIYPGLERLNQTFDKTAFNLARDRQILHIATHGFFSPVSSSASYLMLGNKTPWSINEIQNQQQVFANLRLVVLSACETALGGQQSNPNDPNVADGREISAIAQSFIDASAGQATVVASLWKVNDISTSELMQSFYQNLAKPGERVAIAQALQAAQLQLLHSDPSPPSSTPAPRSGKPTQFAHPYYWSPFIIIGNGL